MKFLFWNIEKKSSCFDVIVDLVRDEAFDVIAIAELPIGQEENLLTRLQVEDSNYLKLIATTPEKVFVYYKKSTTQLKNQFNEGKVAIKKVTSNKGTIISYVSFLHLDSKVNCSDEELAERINTISRSVQNFEEDPDIEKGILLLCGDLNMNPFEKGMIKANGLNAVMDCSIAKKGSRTIQGTSYRYFYNPMWGFLGDLGKGDVSGTYYYNPSYHIQYFWNLYDQVLLRPEAIPYFDMDSLRIITKSSHYQLLKNSGIIDDNLYSDHLPITFTLTI